MSATNLTAMVTGAARGIGRATAVSFANTGYDVVLADIDTEAAETVSAEIAELDQRGLVVEMDVSDSDSVQTGVHLALEEFGGIDVLVNNAGIQTDRTFFDLQESEWDQVIDINLKGMFLVGQRVATEMVDRDIEGRIVNVTSIHQSVPRKGKSNYDASKGGAWMLTKDMALELSEHHINVNAVAPGAVRTPMNDELLEDDEASEAIASLVPWKRWATAEEVADVVRYLGHEAPDYVTGSVLRVDGGLSLVGVE